jgi:hypothetical protein
MPSVCPKEPAEENPVFVDLEIATPWKISCIQEGLGGQYNHDTIVEMLRRCRGNIDRAFANLLDEESSTSSTTSSSASATSSQSSVTTMASSSKDERPFPSVLQATFKPRLASSRSSSRHSTASKRSADDSDDEGGPILGRRQRGREQKRRILPKVTVGINIGDQEKPDLVSLRLRVGSDAEAKQASPSPADEIPPQQPEQSGQREQPDQSRKLRPRRPNNPIPVDRKTRSASSATSTETEVNAEVKVEE